MGLHSLSINFFLSIVMLATSNSLAIDKNGTPLEVIDGFGKERYNYRTAHTLLHNAGFNTKHRTLYQFIESPTISAPNTFFFINSATLLKTDNPFVSVYRQTLKGYAHEGNHCIGLIIPGNQPPIIQQGFKKLLQEIGWLKGCSQNTKKLVYTQLNTYLNQLHARQKQQGTYFGTSLLTKKKVTLAQSKKLTSLCNKQIELIWLPQKQHGVMHVLAPLAALLKNKQTNTTYFISTSSDLLAMEIAEQFMLLPFKKSEQVQLINTLQQTLVEAYTATFGSSPKRHIKKTEALKSPQTQGQPLTMAWLDFADFFGEHDALGKLKKLAPANTSPEEYALKISISKLKDMSYDIWWIEFLPEQFLSTIGTKKAELDSYKKRIARLANELKSQYQQTNTPLPKIYVGMNVTTNFKSALVKNPVTDVYGASYSQIPSALDHDQVWHSEVTKVFAEFYRLFNEYLPIDGVCLDLEMYHAPQQTAGYTDLMDFSDLAWNMFTQTDAQAAQKKTFKKRINYLKKEKKFSSYLQSLDNEARNLGKTIKQDLRKIKPNLELAVYTPTLPSSWFYRGFLGGLSEKEKPVLCATFNTRFLPHKSYLDAREIYLKHGTVLMLSKVESNNDISMANELQKSHDFVWFNRPSRRVYQYTKQELEKVWWGIESFGAQD